MPDYKRQKCDDFCEMLDRFNISYVRHTPYHIQIQIQHNFYPSNHSYYNSGSGKKCRIPEFKDGNDVLMFLSTNVYASSSEARFKASEIVELLEGATNLESAINYFKTLINE